mgnify:CR=1 FL=1
MIRRDGDTCSVEGPLTLGNITAALAESDPLMNGDSLTVDLATVTEVDSAAVSLLLEWRRMAQARGFSIRYVNLPKNLNSLAELYGVRDIIVGAG